VSTLRIDVTVPRQSLPADVYPYGI